MLSVTSLNVSTPSYALFGEKSTVSSVSLGTSIKDGVTKYRILALSEGVHNNLVVKSKDIKQMVYDVQSNPDLVIPVVLDHSFNFNDIVGKVLNIQFYDQYTMPNGNILNGVAVAEIQLLASSEGTPKLNETLYRMQMLPELAKFSVAFKFAPTTDEVGNVTVHDLKLQHIAIVTNPADPSTGIIEKFSKREEPRSGSLSYDIDMDNLINRGTNMPSRRNTQFKSTPRRATYSTRRSARFNNSATEDIVRNALPRTGTYPIRNVQSINLAPGQRSPLMCDCADELYDRQSSRQTMPAEFAKRRNARLNASRKARLSGKGRSRFTEYGAPYVHGSPFGYPISDTYDNVNQLIALRRKQAALGKRAKMLTNKEEDARFGRTRNTRFSNARKTRFSGSRRSRFDDDFAAIPRQQHEYNISDVYAPVASEYPPFYGNPASPAYAAPVSYAPPTGLGPVVPPMYEDYVVDPVVQAYIEAGLIFEDEIPVVEAALRSHRARMGRRSTAKMGRRPSARMGRRPSAKMGRRPSAKMGRSPSGRRPSAKMGRRPSARRSSKFEGLINEYMLPSANIPREQNVNVKRDAALGRKHNARLSARKSTRSGSFFRDGGKVRSVSKLSDSRNVPVQNTSISPNSTANTVPSTFVGKDGSSKKLIEELKDAKFALESANKLTNLRAVALSMNFADKDFVLSLNETQLNTYIESRGLNNQAALSGQMNPFVGQLANKEAVGNYIAEFADNFTKGTQKMVATINQTSPSAEAKAEKIFGGN